MEIDTLRIAVSMIAIQSSVDKRGYPKLCKCDLQRLSHHTPTHVQTW